MSSVQKQKAKLRIELKELRSKITKDDYQVKSEQIKDALISFLGKQKAEIIHCFISMNSRLEVDTHSIIDELFKMGKTIVVPIMKGDFLEHSTLESIHELIENSWGVLEPEKKSRIDVKSIDMVIVPLLGVDENGNRLGYGKGYYDKFLETTEALKIGLVFEKFVFKHIPTEKHDIKLDGFITEKGVRLL